MTRLTSASAVHGGAETVEMRLPALIIKEAS
jgi:hypothetical protein